MAAALSLAMPKEAFDQFLADTYGIDGLNKLEVADARGAATHAWGHIVIHTSRASCREKASTGTGAPDFFLRGLPTYPSASRGLRPRVTTHLHL